MNIEIIYEQFDENSSIHIFEEKEKGPNFGRKLKRVSESNNIKWYRLTDIDKNYIDMNEYNNLYSEMYEKIVYKPYVYSLRKNKIDSL